MGLLSSIFSRKDAAPAEAAEQARTRARRRLIGAAVLVGLGVLGFPLLFETQPRPIAVDVPIEIPRKDAVPPLTVPAPRTAPASAAVRRDDAASEPRADAGREMAPPASAPPASAPPAASSPGPAPSRTKPPPTPPPARSTKPPAVEKPPAPAPAPAATPAAPAGARIVVQVGAYADAGAAREARQRVEKLGLKAFTQAVDTDAGKRIRVRVGPFATREQAEQAAARIKAAGLPAAVIAP